MNNEELKAVVRSALDNSIAASEIEEDQAQALDRFYGKPYGTERDGHSKVVTREVMETVEWTMPSLMRVFAGSEKVVEFTAVGPDDMEAAELETRVVNHVATKTNNWFSVVHNWCKDALISKVGYVKVYWDEDEEQHTEQYTGLSDQQLAALLAEDGVEPVEHDQEFAIVPDPETGEPMQVAFHDVTIKRMTKVGDLVLENVPQEEMRVSKKANSVCLDDLDMVAHVGVKTRSDLMGMGVDPKQVNMLGREGENKKSLEYARDQYGSDDDENSDRSMEECEFSEVYMRVDYDGDGYAELRRICMSGNEILRGKDGDWNEEWDVIPFAAITPSMMPHVHAGISTTDKVADIQEKKTALFRQVLDNLNLTNNPEKEVLWSQVNHDDLRKSGAGKLNRVKQMGSIREITVPFTAGASIPIMDVLDGMKESRTGVSRQTMGLDADVLAKSTMGAYQTAHRQSNQQLELIARTFAETGIKSLFLKIHALLIKHQDSAKQYRLGDEWVEVNPSEWRERKQMTVTVGVGTGDVAEQIGYLQMILQDQQQHILQGSPMVTMQHLYHTYERLIELGGLKDVQRYYQDPSQIEEMPAQEPEEPPIEEQLAKMQIELEMMKEANLKERTELEKQKLLLQIQVEEAKVRAAERESVEGQQGIMIKGQKMDNEARLQETKLAADIQLKQRELELKERDLEMTHEKLIADFELKITDQMSPIIQSIAEIERRIVTPDAPEEML
jgi:hypothetical protein